jgi:hypothetical protein
VDFSKSTDPISIPLAKFVLNTIVSHTGEPDWWKRALDKAFDHNTIYDPLSKTRKKIQCGALMGLGTGWTVLTVLNSWCAWEAGVRKEAFRTCGDDLIGLFTKEQILRYQRNVEAIHLKLNHTKSFQSTHRGVFCERFVERVSPTKAVARPLLRIGEACGSKSTAAGKGTLSVDHLRQLKGHKALLHEARTTANRYAVSLKIPGLLRHGGGGSSLPPDHITVINYLQFGGNKLQRIDYDQEISEVAKRLWKLAETDSSTVPIEEVLTSAKASKRRFLQEEGRLQIHNPSRVARTGLRAKITSRYHHTIEEVKAKKGPIALLRHLRKEHRLRIELTDAEFQHLANCFRGKRYTKAISYAQNLHRGIPRHAATDLITHLPHFKQNFSIKYLPIAERWDFKQTRKERGNVPSSNTPEEASKIIT